MMRKTMMAAGMAAIMLAGCAKSGPPPKREPGSWSSKFELKRVEGKDADKAKAAMTPMFAMMSAMSICVTPEMSAKEDPTQDVEKLGGPNGRCTFDRKSIAGGTIDVAGTCKLANGKTTKVTATGTLGASVQDMDTTVEVFDATGAKEGLMEIANHSTRNGECTAKDMKSPPATM
ncbi:DUF3617 family protein [Sphingomonas bacterium]|uniref:DUF3617 domain-containing protein n=1 Tax=Sphingomonas bacterium TaxID=1895847 RepID=UPI002610D124|nr:DUF3617 family protein [Sphingomonas bacterium]